MKLSSLLKTTTTIKKQTSKQEPRIREVSERVQSHRVSRTESAPSRVCSITEDLDTKKTYVIKNVNVKSTFLGGLNTS